MKGMRNKESDGKGLNREMKRKGTGSFCKLLFVQVAAANIEPEPMVLSEMARVTDAVLQRSNELQEEEVEEAAKILEKVIDLSASSSGGIDAQVATAILGCVFLCGFLLAGAVSTVANRSNESAQTLVTSLITSLGTAMEESLPVGNESAYVEARTGNVSLVVTRTHAPVLNGLSINISVTTGESEAARVLRGHSSWFDLRLPPEVELLKSEPTVVELSLPRFKGRAHVRTVKLASLWPVKLESGR